MDTAIRLFQQALNSDSLFTLTWAGLGEAYWRKYEATKDIWYIEPAKASCRRAIKQNDRRNKSDDSLMFITMSNVKYLRQYLPAQSESRMFIINENANPDSLDKIYPFAVFCRNAAYAAERNSSPIIIVKPDN